MAEWEIAETQFQAAKDMVPFDKLKADRLADHRAHVEALKLKKDWCTSCGCTVLNPVRDAQSCWQLGSSARTLTLLQVWE